ncbi:MAG: hypothetical protein J0L92_34175 [Deltaproteobacteria bacterium]|nr:hypothetical protein [Deltaproteobacteria bacterium]
MSSPACAAPNYQPVPDDRISIPFSGRTGFLNLRGYDPVRGVLCGDLEIVLTSEESVEMVQRGMFSARLFDPSERSPDASADAPFDAGVPDTSDSCRCDDGVACTTDSCVDGACNHAPRHALCASGEYCAEDGCTTGAVCGSDAACATSDPCLTVRCEPSTRRCFYAPRDGDGDGEPPLSCGGGDCDDADPDVHPGATEACDGIDADCSGGADPADASGCRPDEVCLGATCGCAAGETLCDLRVEFGSIDCRDLQTDAFTCGGCNNHCAFGQECVDGECRCAAGRRDCIATHGVCADVSTDPSHCGGCGAECPLRCVGGECLCPSPLVRCSDASEEWCAELGTDVRNCGECGNSCLWFASCSTGRCSVDVGGFFDAYGRPGTPIAASPRLARDATTGNVILGFRSGSGVTGARGRLPTVPEVITATSSSVNSTRAAAGSEPSRPPASRPLCSGAEAFTSSSSSRGRRASVSAGSRSPVRGPRARGQRSSR